MKRWQNNMRAGFSLMELLIVIAIVGILATLSIGYMISARPHAQLEQAELELYGTFVEARQLARSEELRTRVAFSLGARAYHIDRLDPSTGSWVQVGIIERLPEGFSFQGTTFASNDVNFTPRGTLVTGGNLTIAAPTGETRVFRGVVPTGRFNIQRGNLR